MKEALQVLIAAAAPVTDIVGARHYTAKRPQNDPFPSLVIHRVSQNPDHHHLDTSNLVFATYSIQMFAVTNLIVDTLAKALAVVLDGFRGGVAVVGGTKHVGYIHLASERDDEDDPISGDDTTVFRVTQDYDIAHYTTIIP